MCQCHARRLICYFQGQGHNEGLYNQILLFVPYLQNYWSFLQPDVMGWYIAGVLLKIRLLFSRSRCCPLNLDVSFILCATDLMVSNQTGCADVLLIITKPSTIKMGYLTYSITRHTIGGWVGGFATQGNKLCLPYTLLLKRSRESSGLFTDN